MTSTNPHTLDLFSLWEGIPALTTAAGVTMIEACMICFEHQGHSSGVELKIGGDYAGAFTVTWPDPVTDEMRRYWADEQYTTEQAAYGIALLL